MRNLSFIAGSLFAVIVLSLLIPGNNIPVHHHDMNGRPYSETPVWHPAYKTTFTEEYTSNAVEPALESLQCPIPKEYRVRNYTGIQCVFASIEMIGRWAECKQLIDPPITSRKDCKSYSGPTDASNKLRRFGVKFEQSYRNREQGVRLIKKAMREGRGCLWGVPGHAMVLVHYSEEEDRICWVDNSDRSLKVQTGTIKDFNRRWDTWVLVIYADPDVIPYKLFGPWKIPIQDHNKPKDPAKPPREYFPIPRAKLDSREIVEIYASNEYEISQFIKENETWIEDEEYTLGEIVLLWIESSKN
jgi:hypothetical protein